MDTKASSLYLNFIAFCCLYAVSHSTINVVLAFAAAELGNTTAAYGGFCVYVGFTLSSFIISKPFSRIYGAKYTLIAGMICHFIFVMSFCLSLISPEHSPILYIVGSCFGGLGEGLFWTGQGIYYSMNSIEYARGANVEVVKVMSQFATIFAVLYLTIEAISKVLSTILFSAVKESSSSEQTYQHWKLTLFIFYALEVIISALLFYVYIIPFKDNQKLSTTNTSSSSASHNERSGLSRSFNYSSLGNNSTSVSCNEILNDSRSVASALYNKRLLQYITPFQLAFGVAGVFMDSYINGVIVKTYAGEQYIGALSGILSISSVLVAFPYAYISLNMQDGNYYVMIFGCCCFMLTALPILIFSDATIGQWSFIVWLFVAHGFARGAWENTNKAIIGEYFAVGVEESISSPTTNALVHNGLSDASQHENLSPSIHGGGTYFATSNDNEIITSNNNEKEFSFDDSLRDTAFASTSFTSSFAGAIAYICFKYFNRTELALLNIIIAVIAALGFHLSYQLFQAQKQLQYAFDFNETMRKGGSGSSEVYNGIHHRDNEDDTENGFEFVTRREISKFTISDVDDDDTSNYIIEE